MSNLPRHRSLRARRITAGISATLAAVALTACSDPDQPATPEEQTTTSVKPTTSATETSAETATSTRSSTSETPTTTSKPSSADGVTEAREVFSTLAPASLWESFDSCDPTGLEGSYECAGSEVGSFQFFDSKSKAASTTQLITELRSSQVVADTGRFVVGWSTLGTTAVITVVDNDEGQVMQQLVSSDIEDPDKKIEELGLTDPPFDAESAEATEPTAATSTAAEESTPATTSTQSR